MDRKGFLHRVFGAAVVAAIPKIVVDQIETLPPPPIVKTKPIFVDERTDIAVEPKGDNCIYLYKNNILLGYSHEGNIEMDRSVLEVSSIHSSYPEYIRGYSEYFVSMKKLKWLQGWGLLDEYFTKQIPVEVLCKRGNYVITGKCLIIERTNMWLGSGWVDIKLQVTGQLIIDNHGRQATPK